MRDDQKVENVYERVRGTVELITIVMPVVNFTSHSTPLVMPTVDNGEAVTRKNKRCNQNFIFESDGIAGVC